MAAAAAAAVPAPRPTCKVVLRTYAGTRGARIHPKGCQVRSYADDDTRDNIRKYNKTATGRSGQLIWYS